MCVCAEMLAQLGEITITSCIRKRNSESGVSWDVCAMGQMFGCPACAFGGPFRERLSER